MSNMSNLATEYQEEGRLSVSLSSAPTETKSLTKEEKREKAKKLAKETKERRQKLAEEILERPLGKINTPKEYWETCFALVFTAGVLASHDKLLMTYRDKSNRHNVIKVINDKNTFKYGVRSVKYARSDDINDFWKLLDSINWYAREHGLAQVSSMKMLGILDDAKVREKYRDHILDHIETEHPPFEIDELPDREFRKTKTARG